MADPSASISANPSPPVSVVGDLPKPVLRRCLGGGLLSETCGDTLRWMYLESLKQLQSMVGGTQVRTSSPQRPHLCSPRVALSPRSPEHTCGRARPVSRTQLL